MCKWRLEEIKDEIAKRPTLTIAAEDVTQQKGFTLATLLVAGPANKVTTIMAVCPNGRGSGPYADSATVQRKISGLLTPVAK